ncbi:MAG: hypothetical protein JOZ75_11800 [Candidatus Dormibacteraeota bacterium]|nr:hypothetical protein [Candidatus Dormibacteraeota bacterium]
MIVHVLSGSVVPLPIEWVAALLLFGGAFAALAVRGRRWRQAAIAVSALGLVMTGIGWVADSAQPGPAPYALRIVAPSRSTPPNAVFTVCGLRGDGTLLTPTDAQHWLVPFVDDRQRPATDAPVYPVRLTPGEHTVRFDLVNPSNREFSPPAEVTEHVTVDTTAPAMGPQRC